MSCTDLTRPHRTRRRGKPSRAIAASLPCRSRRRVSGTLSTPWASCPVRSCRGWRRWRRNSAMTVWADMFAVVATLWPLTRISLPVRRSCGIAATTGAGGWSQPGFRAHMAMSVARFAWPGDWGERFPEGAGAPMLFARRGLGTFFLPRAPRRVGKADGELLHQSIRERMATDPRYRPIGRSAGCRGRNRAISPVLSASHRRR